MAIMDGNVKELNCNLIYIYIVVDASSSMCANVINLDLDESILFLHMIEDEDTGILINKNDVCEIMTEKNFLEDCFQSTELFDISLSVLEMTICNFNFIKYRVYFYGNSFKLLLVGSIKERDQKLNTSRLRISIGILLWGKIFIVKLLNADSITYQENNYNLLVGEIWGIQGNEYLLKDNQYHFIKDLTRKISIGKEILILNNCFMKILFPIWLNNVRRGSV